MKTVAVRFSTIIGLKKATNFLNIDSYCLKEELLISEPGKLAASVEHFSAK